MNTIISYSEQNGIIIDNDILYYKGQEYPLPKKCGGHSVTMIDDHIFVDGYEFKDGKFKRTLRALWHKYF